MRMTKLILAATAALLVGGGASTSPAERRLADEGRCRSHGFRAGTDAFAKCLLDLDLDLDRAADRRALENYPYGFGGPGWYGGRPWIW